MAKHSMRGLRARLTQAKKRVAKETREIELAQSRRQYWRGIVNFLEGRLEAKENGQLEMF